MRRNFRVWRTFVRASIARDLEFRANFFAKMLQNLTWFLFFFVIIQVLYANTTTIAGWGRGSAYILTGTITLVDSTLFMCFWGLTEIPSMVRQGTLDFLVSKPVDGLFWASMRMFRVDTIGRMAAGIGLVIWGCSIEHFAFSLPNVLAYLFLVLCAMITFYTVMAFLMTLAVWFVRVDNLWVISDVINMTGRNPIDIWPQPTRMILTYYLPIAVIASIPARQLRSGWSAPDLLTGLAWVIGGLVVVRLFWDWSMKHYSSASS